MPEVVTCPQCERKLRVPDDLLGKKVKCPTCSTTFTADAGVGGAPAEEEAPRPASKRPARPPQDEEEFEEEVRPRRARPVAARDEAEVEDDYVEDDLEEDDDRPRRRPKRGRRRGAAIGLVSGPATALMISGIVSILFAVLGLVMNLAGVGMGGAGMAGPGNKNDAMANLSSGVAGMSINIVSICLQGIVIAGALKMKNLQSRGMAMAAAIITVIPCTTCLCWGVPIGIWALTALNKPEVKDAFE